MKLIFLFSVRLAVCSFDWTFSTQPFVVVFFFLDHYVIVELNPEIWPVNGTISGKFNQIVIWLVLTGFKNISSHDFNNDITHCINAHSRELRIPKWLTSPLWMQSFSSRIKISHILFLFLFFSCCSYLFILSTGSIGDLKVLPQLCNPYCDMCAYWRENKKHSNFI